MIEFLNVFFDVLRQISSFLFSLVIVPGVSVGSLLLWSLVMFAFVSNLYPKGK